MSSAGATSRGGGPEGRSRCSPLRGCQPASQAVHLLPTPTLRADFSSIAPLRSLSRLIQLAIITGNRGDETLATQWRYVMLGLMQQQPLLISTLLKHAARHHGAAEVVSATEAGTVRH